jgi:hypothetical protein
LETRQRALRAAHHRVVREVLSRGSTPVLRLVLGVLGVRHQLDPQGVLLRREGGGHSCLTAMATAWCRLAGWGVDVALPACTLVDTDWPLCDLPSMHVAQIRQLRGEVCSPALFQPPTIQPEQIVGELHSLHHIAVAKLHCAGSAGSSPRNG